jgi:hypothetical protein
MNSTAHSQNQSSPFTRTLLMVFTIIAVLAVSACGSTKVYNNDKTVVYNGAIYNLSKVTQIEAMTTAKLSDTETVSLKGANRKQVETYLEQFGTIYVRMAFQLDDREMLYRASSVSKWNEYSKMQKSFQNAEKQITSLLGNKKKMQLKLK